MEFLIISGMSGAGKSQAADILEDMDYYCVDNLPLALLGRFAELCLASAGRYGTWGSSTAYSSWRPTCPP